MTYKTVKDKICVIELPHTSHQREMLMTSGEFLPIGYVKNVHDDTLQRTGAFENREQMISAIKSSGIEITPLSYLVELLND